jgi:glutaredoxin 3
VVKIDIYTSPYCGFCFRAKNLLSNKGVTFNEIDVVAHPDRRTEMLERSNGQSTVPQIFIDNSHIGGFDDLDALNTNGVLNNILS